MSDKNVLALIEKHVEKKYLNVKTKLFKISDNNENISSPLRVDMFKLKGANRRKGGRRHSLVAEKNEISKLVKSRFNLKEIPKEQLIKLRELNSHLKEN